MENSTEKIDWEKLAAFLEPEPPKFCPHTPFLKQKAFLRVEALEAMYGGRAGGGKMVEISTLVPVSTGFKKMGDIKVGDYVFDEMGNPTKVIAKSDIESEPTYLVTMTDGEEIIAGERHLWNVAIERDRARYKAALPENQARRRAHRSFRGQTAFQLASKAAQKGKASSSTGGNSTSTALMNSMRAAEKREGKERPNIWDYTRTVTTKQIIELQKTERKRISIPNAAPIEGQGEWLSEIPPYTFGAWLGDGCSSQGYIYCGHQDTETLMTELEADGWTVVEQSVATKGRQNTFYKYKLVNKNGETLGQLLREEGHLNNKHIPDWILLTPFTDRQAFLGGLFDTGGHVDERGRVQLCMAKEHIVKQAHMIAWSLGLTPTSVKEKQTVNQIPGFQGTAWRFEISQCNEYLFRFTRKRDALSKNRIKKVSTTEYRQIRSVVEIEPAQMQCIQVANPRGLYRVGKTFLTTHNSDALIMGALQWVHIPGYSAMIFRNSFADLALPGAIMDRAKQWFSEYPEIRWSAQMNQATFPSGASITFGYLQNPDDHLRYKGTELQYIGFDEVTEIREESYRYLLSRLRKPAPSTGLPLSKVPLRARSATNPAANWVRRYFLEEGASKGRIYIPAGYEDNLYIDHASYAEALSLLSPVHRAQLEFGDWYAEETGKFFNREDFKIIAPEELPNFGSRSIIRYWDLAATEPSDSNPDPDWTVGAKVAIANGYMFILDIVRFRGSPEKVERVILETAARDGAGVRIRMDQDPGQAGKAVVSHYGRNVLLGYDFAGSPVSKDKQSRVGLWAPKAKRGEILLVRGDWAGDFIDEAVGFGANKSLHDDQMDAVSGAFENLTGIHVKKRGTVRIIV